MKTWAQHGTAIKFQGDRQLTQVFNYRGDGYKRKLYGALPTEEEIEAGLLDEKVVIRPNGGMDRVMLIIDAEFEYCVCYRRFTNPTDAEPAGLTVWAVAGNDRSRAVRVFNRMVQTVEQQAHSELQRKQDHE